MLERAAGHALLGAVIVVLGVLLIVAQFVAFLMSFGLPGFFVADMLWGTLSEFLLLGAALCNAWRVTLASREAVRLARNAEAGLPCSPGLLAL